MNYTISHIYDDYIDTEKFIDKSVFKDKITAEVFLVKSTQITK